MFWNCHFSVNTSSNDVEIIFIHLTKKKKKKVSQTIDAHEMGVPWELGNAKLCLRKVF